MKILIRNGQPDFSFSWSPQGTKVDSPLPSISSSDITIDYEENKYKLIERLIAKSKSCALERLGEFFSDGETVQQSKFGIIKEGPDYYKNSPVLDVTTNKSSFLIVYDELILSNGAIRNKTLQLGNYAPVPVMLQSALAMLFVKTFAMAVGKVIAKELFDKFFPKSEDGNIRSELGKLKNEIKEILQEQKYENFEDYLITTRAWLRDTYSERLASYNNGHQENANAIIADLKKHQEEILKPVIDIIEARTTDKDLDNCDYLTRVKVAIYTASVCLRVIIYKEQIFWQKIANIDNNSSINELRKFIDKTKGIISKYNSSLQAGRYDKISGVHAGGAKEFNPPMRVDWIEWKDNFESSKKQDPFKGGKIHDRRGYTAEGSNENKDEIYKKVSKSQKEHKHNVEKLFNKWVDEPLSDAYSKLNKTKIEITA